MIVRDAPRNALVLVVVFVHENPRPEK